MLQEHLEKFVRTIESNVGTFLFGLFVLDVFLSGQTQKERLMKL